VVSSDLRKTIDGLIGTGAAEAASRSLTELWRREASPATAQFLITSYNTIREHLSLRSFRLAILRSFTVEPAVPLLRAAAFTAGIDLTVHVGDFNAYAQEILDADGRVFRFAPDVVILAVQTCDIAPDLWRGYADLTPQGSAAAATRVMTGFCDWVRAFRKRSQASLVLHTLEQPARSSMGVLDGQSSHGQSSAILQINHELRRLAEKHNGVYVLDYDALVARHGRVCWRDEGKWLTARMPIAAGHLIHLAQEWLRFLVPLSGKISKALVVDLDNTLWKGVIGEDGIAGIQIGPEYPGAAYQALQRAILDLYQRGIILAICSKNNQEDAMEALRNHPGMILRPNHFAAMRINWGDKAQNLREIAAGLNIGTDALAFLDDNPVEREQVRMALPEVNIIELPDDPLGFADTLRDQLAFERLTLSEEDRQRGSYYAAQDQRLELLEQVTSKEDFYRSLEQEAEISPVAPATLSRVAQLTRKTNQFNLTTQRYEEQQIAELAKLADWQVVSMRVRDRYGDNGLVGVAITHQAGTVCEIDTFLMSCRVIGRTVETAFLSCLVEQARERGARLVRGWFFPTNKNAPAKNFYSDHGFELVTQNEKGSLWELSMSAANVNCPDWVRLIVHGGVKK
jgi:FkbH-like protein